MIFEHYFGSAIVNLEVLKMFEARDIRRQRSFKNAFHFEVFVQTMISFFVVSDVGGKIERLTEILKLFPPGEEKLITCRLDEATYFQLDVS